MRRLTSQKLREFVGENRLLLGTPERPGLMQTPDDRIVKSFYQRKRISTSTFIPQARRFANNSQKLLDKNIAAPLVEDIIYCQDVPVHMVIYPRLEGTDLRTLCERGHLDCLTDLSAFLCHLHGKGVYFRAIHLGNLLRREDGSFAVVDIADLNTRSRPLGPFQRARNLAHLINTEGDKPWFARYGVHRFLNEYLTQCDLSPGRRWLLGKRVAFALDEDVKHSLAREG